MKTRLLQSILSLTGLLGCAQLGNATVITFSTEFGNPTPLSTDLTNYTLSVTSFVPGTNSIPINAILDSFRIRLSLDISGTFTVKNTSDVPGPGSEEDITGNADSRGYIYLFTPTSHTSLSHSERKADDIFTGTGPHPTFVSDPVTLEPGETSDLQAYDQSASKTGNNLTNPTYLSNVQAGPTWNAYFSTLTFQGSNVAGGGSSTANFTTVATGTLYVDYTYHLGAEAPEPGTMMLFGSAIAGLAVLRRRRSK